MLSKWSYLDEHHVTIVLFEKRRWKCEQVLWNIRVKLASSETCNRKETFRMFIAVLRTCWAWSLRRLSCWIYGYAYNCQPMMHNARCETGYLRFRSALRRRHVRIRPSR